MLVNNIPICLKFYNLFAKQTIIYFQSSINNKATGLTIIIFTTVSIVHKKRKTTVFSYCI